MKTKEYFISTAKHVVLDLPIDHKAILEEAKRLKDKFVTHRPGKYDHKGWKSLVLHGLGENKTEDYKAYGYASAMEAAEHSGWTPIADECPNTVNFLLSKFPSESFARVRFMLLEAGGYISQHNDSSVPLLEHTNIALSNPEGCVWTWGDGEQLHMTPGKAYVVNIHYPHAIVNNSNEDRIHLIVHRYDCTPLWKSLLDKAVKEQHADGYYVEHEVLI